MKRKIKVGIPRALSYYTFYPLWRTFLEKLGAEVVVSKPTNRKILEEGIRGTVNDACIPIKVFHGHVFDLAGKVDFIFVPRMVSADGRATFCPKFLGLPDMIRYCDVVLPAIIDVRYQRRIIPGFLILFFYAVALQIGVRNPLAILRAACLALYRQMHYQRLLLKGIKPPEAFDLLFHSSQKTQDDQLNLAHKEAGSLKYGSGKVLIGLLGYPYALYDHFISAGVYHKLVKLGAEVVTFEEIPLKEMRRCSRIMPQNFFWYYSNQVCWAGLHLLEKKNLVDGIIHVTAFGCGPDAMVDKTLELEAKHAGIPFISLAIDEHTGEGGVQTRLEAFVDMLLALKTKNMAG